MNTQEKNLLGVPLNEGETVSDETVTELSNGKGEDDE